MKATYRRIFYYSLIASLGGLLFGFDIAVFSGTIPFIQPELDLTPKQLGWIGSCLYIGCIIGSLMFGPLAQKIGRIPSFILVGSSFAISSILMGISSNIQSLVIWRIIAGVSVGGASILSPLYIAEISPINQRGKMVSINQLAVVIGVLIAYISNYYLSFTEWNWRWMFISGAGPAILFLIFVPFLPESPKWLISKGYMDKGIKQLKKIVTPINYESEISKIKSGTFTAPKKINLKTLISENKNGFLLFIAIIVAIFQQISGANAVLFYAPIIFEQTGMSVNDQLFIQILIGAVNMFATLIAMKNVDRFGRKKLMLIGSATMSILLLLIAMTFHNLIVPASMISVLVLLFIAVYAATLAPVTWIIIAEIFPRYIREVSMSIASSFLWAACFILTFVFPIMIDQLSAFQTFLIFSILCCIYFIFLFLFVPETKNNKM